LTRTPKDVFLGMVVAAYAIGSRHGIVYLRAEYVYLRRYLESQLPGPRAGAAPSSRRSTVTDNHCAQSASTARPGYGCGTETVRSTGGRHRGFEVRSSTGVGHRKAVT